MARLPRHCVALGFSLLALTGATASADDPCEDASKATEDFAAYLSEWAQTRAEISGAGSFKVTPRQRNGVVHWYEVEYSEGGQSLVWSVLPQLKPAEGTLDVSVGEQSALSLRYAYGAAGRIACSFEVRAKPGGFEAVARKAR